MKTIDVEFQRHELSDILCKYVRIKSKNYFKIPLKQGNNTYYIRSLFIFRIKYLNLYIFIYLYIYIFIYFLKNSI